MWASSLPRLTPRCSHKPCRMLPHRERCVNPNRERDTLMPMYHLVPNILFLFLILIARFVTIVL